MIIHEKFLDFLLFIGYNIYINKWEFIYILIIKMEKKMEEMEYELDLILAEANIGDLPLRDIDIEIYFNNKNGE